MCPKSDINRESWLYLIKQIKWFLKVLFLDWWIHWSSKTWFLLKVPLIIMKNQQSQEQLTFLQHWPKVAMMEPIYTLNVPIFSLQRMFASGSNLITCIVSKHEPLPGNISSGPVYHFHSASLVIYKYCLGHLEDLL